EIRAELHAQYRRFGELVGRPPAMVNAHHHVQIFPPIGAILRELLSQVRPLPYLRKVRESWPTLARVPGAKLKRLMLTMLGQHAARKQMTKGFPGNDWLMGVTNPPCVADPEHFTRWLRCIPGRVVELACHPGHLDTSLVGRDCTNGDGQLLWR